MDKVLPNRWLEAKRPTGLEGAAVRASVVLQGSRPRPQKSASQAELRQERDRLDRTGEGPHAALREILLVDQAVQTHGYQLARAPIHGRHANADRLLPG